VATRHLPLLPAEARDHEPRTALDGGDDGLDVFRRVIAMAPEWLRPTMAALETPGQATASPPGPAQGTSDGVPEPIPSAARGASGEPLAVPGAAGEPLTVGGASSEPSTARGGSGEPAESVAGRDRQWVGGIVLSEITEAQIDAAVAVVEGAGLRAEIAYDEDLDATVIIGHR
jgi:methylase of polypeptide subunit release factors